MATFKRPAVQIKQGHLTLYLTYVTPRDLFANNFYSVEKLEPHTEKGFQRIVKQSRVNKLARHLREAHPWGYAQLPTTVFFGNREVFEL